MVIVKNEKTNEVVGKMNSDAKHIQVGESICDVPNKKTYRVVSKIYNLTDGNVIGLVVV